VYVDKVIGGLQASLKLKKENEELKAKATAQDANHI
jgi:hypothetical protein